MKRKKFVKMLMSRGLQRNEATGAAKLMRQSGRSYTEIWRAAIVYVAIHGISVCALIYKDGSGVHLYEGFYNTLQDETYVKAAGGICRLAENITRSIAPMIMAFSRFAVVAAETARKFNKWREKYEERILYGDNKNAPEPKGIINSLEQKVYADERVPEKRFQSNIMMLSKEEHENLHKAGWKPWKR